MTKKLVTIKSGDRILIDACPCRGDAQKQYEATVLNVSADVCGIRTQGRRGIERPYDTLMDRRKILVVVPG